MTNREKYVQIFTETFKLQADQLEELSYQSIPEWDSVGHMELITALEDAFDIMMDTDDIIDFNSFKKGMEILSEKYDLAF